MFGSVKPYSDICIVNMTQHLILTIMTTMRKIKKGAMICGIDDILFPVEVRDEEMASNKEYSKRIVGQINGADFLLNQCSDIYKLVPNADVFPNIEAVLDAHGIEYTVTYKHINHVRFYADYKITDARYSYTMKGTNDVIMPMIRVQHSYNGLTKYRIIFGFFRLVCSNGATIPVAQMKRFNLVIIGKHTEQIEKSFGKLNEMLIYFGANAHAISGAITEEYEKLGDAWRTAPELRLEEVLEACKIAIIDNAKFNTINDIMSRISAEANEVGLGYNGRINDWLIYNGINQYLNDNSRNIATPEVRMEKDSKVLEYMLNTIS